MNYGRIWLGTSGNETLLSRMGRKFIEEDIEITREGRTVSGKLVIDVIAVKKIFTLEYSTITDTVLKQLQSIYALGGILRLKVERQDTSIDIYSVIFRPFSRSRYLKPGEWLWESINVVLEEI